MGLPGIAASVCSFKRLVKTNRSLDRWKSQEMMTFQRVRLETPCGRLAKRMDTLLFQ